MEPKEAGPLCAQATATLAQAMAKTNDPGALEVIASGLAAVAGRMDPDETGPLCAQAAVILTQAMTKTTKSDDLDRLAQALWAVLTRVDPAQLSRRTAAVVTTVAPLPGCGSAVATLALLGPALEPLPCPLSTPQLVELLKHPTSIGLARRVILDQLEHRYNRKFPDHWAFVRFAQEQKLGLDFTSPPKRPDFLQATRM
jgi:hypothetical protein